MLMAAVVGAKHVKVQIILMYLHANEYEAIIIFN